MVTFHAARESVSHLLTLDFVRLEADTAFEALKSWVICPVVDLNLLIINLLLQPVMWHVASNWRRLTLVASVGDLDGSVFEPVKEDLQNLAGWAGEQCRPPRRR